MNSRIALVAVALSLVASIALGTESAIDPATPVGELLHRLGEPRPSWWVEPDPERIRQGRELSLEGRTTDDAGRRTRVASPAFLCTDCHNVAREDPDLRLSDPEARLDYAIEHDLPLLPGTTLWGTVNRSSWFNDDYEKKYGALVEPSRESLREAVRLCAAECSQGRLLEDWELDAIVAWLWTLEITVGDLDLGDDDLQLIELALGEQSLQESARRRLRDGWLAASPAHARGTPDDWSAGYGHEGDPDRGGEVYRRSCLHCHQARPGDRRGVRGTYPLNEKRGALGRLWRNRTGGAQSLYQVIAWGTRPFGVPMVYMPFFTTERLSDRQIDDLRAYLARELGVEQ
jgi:mono/diheme cytochrome c family protein